MSDLPKFYANIINRLLDSDTREELGPRQDRFQNLATYLSDESEQDTDVITIKR